MDMTPVQKARSVGLVMLTAIFVILALFLLITWIEGDPTDHQKERQPLPSPSSTR